MKKHSRKQFYVFNVLVTTAFLQTLVFLLCPWRVYKIGVWVLMVNKRFGLVAFLLKNYYFTYCNQKNFRVAQFFGFFICFLLKTLMINRTAVEGRGPYFLSTISISSLKFRYLYLALQFLR